MDSHLAKESVSSSLRTSLRTAWNEPRMVTQNHINYFTS